LGLVTRLLLSAILLSMVSCAQQTPLLQRHGLGASSAVTNASCPGAPTTSTSDKLSHKRYLDRMAIIDAQKDFTQAPEPGYVLDADSVVRFPRIEPIGVIFIGDSILTGWSGYFAKVFPNAFLDGRVGRQFSAVLPIWKVLTECHTTRDVRNVVVELGTNGEVSPTDMDAFLRMVGDRQVFLVVPEMPRPWASEVQELYRKTAASHPNVHLIRWDLLSKDHPDYYWSDRVHPNWLGIQVMVRAIAAALSKD